MIRPSRRVRRLANLECNSCGHQFVGRARFVSIETSDRGTVGWNPDRDDARGNICPRCGSEFVRVLGRV